MSCVLCAVRKGRKSCNENVLCLLPANEDMGLLLASVLAEHAVPFERHRNLFGLNLTPDTTAEDRVTPDRSTERVVALLRQVFSEPERQALMVVEDLGFDTSGGDFPQTQSLDEWWRTHQTEWFSAALSEDRFETWFQPIVDPGGGLAFGGSGSTWRRLGSGDRTPGSRARMPDPSQLRTRLRRRRDRGRSPCPQRDPPL